MTDSPGVEAARLARMDAGVVVAPVGTRLGESDNEDGPWTEVPADNGVHGPTKRYITVFLGKPDA